mgnify:CR=1 FL=1
MSDKIKDGGHAFPKTASFHPDGPANFDSEDQSGMTLRDYFAVHSDIGDTTKLTISIGESLLGRECPSWDSDIHGFLAWKAEVRATLRYIEADAMLKARES